MENNPDEQRNLWCDDCDALTPHEKIIVQFLSWQKDYKTCMICDKIIEFDNQDCPKCGWRYRNYEESTTINVKVHHPGCHYNNEELNAESIWHKFIAQNFQFKDIEEIKCNCPEYKIYTDPYCYNSAGGYGSGMNCYDERWWILYIRCPICGERFEIVDDNC